MAISSSPPRVHVDYPSEDGQPMAESDFQREPLTYAVEALGAYFQQRTDVYVSGNLFIYYEEGNPEAVVAPDVFVVFGAPKHRRSSYMLWNEPKAPDFVMEITSRRTRSQDQGPKRGTYAFLGVQEYIGVDILGEIIAENRWRFATDQRRFERADVIRDALPRADAVLCRDLLTHLPFVDSFQALRNFRSSGATYLMTTTFTAFRPNHDSADGEWRTLNLTLPPFSFPPPLRLINEKCSENNGAFVDKSLGVWRFQDLAL